MFNPQLNDLATSPLAPGTWRLDPAQSSVEFRVRKFWGLITVKGRFGRYDGTLDVSGQPAVQLIIEADSLDTKIKKRDEHLRSADFFDVVNHPRVRFEADSVALAADKLTASGHLHTAGKRVPLDVEATVTPAGDEFEIEASAVVDQRELGMTWGPLGMVRAPSTLIVRGRLLRDNER